MMLTMSQNLQRHPVVEEALDGRLSRLVPDLLDHRKVSSPVQHVEEHLLLVGDQVDSHDIIAGHGPHMSWAMRGWPLPCQAYRT